MKKHITILMALLSLSFLGFAQSNIDLRLVNKALDPQQMRATRNDIAPARTIYNVVDGEILLSYRNIYSYDEYEYYLTNVITQFLDLGQWLPYRNTSYEYDFNLMPIEILTQRMEGDWVNDELCTLEYGGDDFIPRLEEEIIQRWENNDWVNVRKYSYNYDPGISILVQEWNGTSFGNHYLYTIEEEFDNTTILLQYWNGGAWMNQENMEITYNENHEISQSITQTWVNEAWSNHEKVDYYYNGPYKLTKVTKTIWDNGQWASNKVKTINYEFNWMGSTHAICESNYGGWEEQNTDIEMFYNEGESILFENVREVEVDYVDVSSLNEQPSSAVVIAPNPTSSYVEVTAEHFLKAEVYNLTGQKVLESLTPTITLKGLASGTYFIKVYHRGAPDLQQLIVR